MALISLDEAKVYLRIDSADEDAMIDSLIQSAGILARDVGRLPDDKWNEINAAPGDADTEEIKNLRTSLRIAVLYALGYLFEHREEADHHDLLMTLRSLLFSVREGIP